MARSRPCPVGGAEREEIQLSAIVEFDSVGLRYGTGAEVLRDLDFRLAKGGFYFLTGPSGAGKTSLLKLLYLAQRPTRGRIRLFDEELTDAERELLPPFRRRIGVVFQDFRLIRHLSAFDNVALPLRVAGAREEEVEGPVREMLAWVGLADRASARPPTLSGGEQQRVAIARAVISRPELLVADEPTGNVDAEMARRLIHLFTALNQLGTTVVVATHDVGLISATPGAQMIRLESGSIVDPHRRPSQPASRAGRDMIFGWMLASPSERRVLGARPLRGPTPWVIAIMTFSMMLVAAAGLALSNTAATVAKGVEARYSVQIPDGRRGFEPVLQAIRTSPGVTSAEGVPEAEMRRLLERWLGPAGASADLPVPALVTFDVRPGADLGAIERRVQASSPGARLIAHRESLGPLVRSLRALQWLALTLVLLLGGAAAAAVVLAARGALDTHRFTIEVMHGIGATDLQITHLFQRKIAVDALDRKPDRRSRRRVRAARCSRQAHRSPES